MENINDWRYKFKSGYLNKNNFIKMYKEKTYERRVYPKNGKL